MKLHLSLRSFSLPGLFALLLLLLTPLAASAQESVTGQWAGTYTNSLGQRGHDSLYLTEGGGRLTGTWTGNIPVAGRRVNANTIQLRGRTATRSYQMTAVVRGNQMTLKYVATRLDAAGAYEGVCTFTRR
ncbi:MAG: hypothetical protein JSR82_15135 [Verrucomicrobia bacterium]|nr:hypothetical protein [Verrucomicrobiota bacterium]